MHECSSLPPGCIRLIKLLPGRRHDRIHYELFTARLADRPQYKALSYVWGSRHTTSPIWERTSQTKKYVTANLERGLKRLRRTDGPLILWVDAICINQSDPNEKSHQVQLMREIFTGSDEVMMYLGEVMPFDSTSSSMEIDSPPSIFYCDHRDASKIASFRSRLSPKASRDCPDPDHSYEVFCLIRWLAGAPDLDNVECLFANNEVHHENIFEALRFLTRCKWWSRVWVVQEIVVPGKVTVYYGSMVAPWEMFVKAASSWTSLAPSPLPYELRCVLDTFARRILDIEHWRQRWRLGDRSDLLSLLRKFRGLQATEPQDSVYALLGLVDNQSIVPDYSLSAFRVFQNTTLQIVQQTGSLSVIFGGSGRKDHIGLPSWVPDWSAAGHDLDSLRAEQNKLYNTSLGGIVRVTDLETMSIQNGRTLNLVETQDGELRLQGAWLDSVAYVGEPMLSAEGLERTIQSWGILVAEWQKTIYSDDSLGDAFRRTLCADLMSDGRQYQRMSSAHSAALGMWLQKGAYGPQHPKGSPSFERVRDCLLDDVDQDGNIDRHDDDPKIRADLDASVQSATHRRRLYITMNGFIGLGPAKMRAGDEIFAIPGNVMPAVLRYARDPVRLEVIGDCYMHGIMDTKDMRSEVLHIKNRQRPRKNEGDGEVEAKIKAKIEVMHHWRSMFWCTRTMEWTGPEELGAHRRMLSGAQTLYLV